MNQGRSSMEGGNDHEDVGSKPVPMGQQPAPLRGADGRQGKRANQRDAAYEGVGDPEPRSGEEQQVEDGMGALGKDMQRSRILDGKPASLRIPTDRQRDDHAGEKEAEDEMSGPDGRAQGSLGQQVFEEGADQPKEQLQLSREPMQGDGGAVVGRLA